MGGMMSMLGGGMGGGDGMLGMSPADLKMQKDAVLAGYGQQVRAVRDAATGWAQRQLLATGVVDAVRTTVTATFHDRAIAVLGQWSAWMRFLQQTATAGASAAAVAAAAAAGGRSRHCRSAAAAATAGGGEDVDRTARSGCCCGASSASTYRTGMGRSRSAAFPPAAAPRSCCLLRPSLPQRMLPPAMNHSHASARDVRRPSSCA